MMKRPEMCCWHSVEADSKVASEQPAIAQQTLHVCSLPHSQQPTQAFFFSWRYNPQWGLYFTAL